MPTVVKRQLTVQQAALPGARLTAGETALSQGAGVEQAREGKFGSLAAVGQDVANIGLQAYAEQQERRRREERDARELADQVAVIGGTNEYTGWKKGYVYDPQTGALSKKGKAAMPLPEEVDAEFEKQAGEILAKMTTPEQKLAMEKFFAQERESLGIIVRRHTDQEITTLTANETKAGVANAIDMAVKEGSQDPKLGKPHLDRAIATIEQMGPKLGLSKEQIDEQVRATKTRTHEGIIDNLIDTGRTMEARAYASEVIAANQVDGDRIDDIKRKVQAGTVKSTAQKEAEKIRVQGGTLAEQLARAEQIDDIDVQDETKRRLEHYSAVFEREKRDQHIEFKKSLADRVDRTRNIDSITVTEMQRLEPDERQAFRGYVKALNDKGDVDTDLPTYYSHMDAAAKDPAKWAASVDLLKDLNKLGKTEFKQLTEMRTVIISGDKTAAAKLLDGYLTNKQVVDAVLSSGGIDPSPRQGTSASKTVSEFQSEVDKAVATWQSVNKKPASNDVIRQIADELMREVIVEKGETANLFTLDRPFWDRKKTIAAALHEMPKELRAQAEESLRKNNRVPTPSAVVDLYIQYLAKQRAGGK